MEIIVACDSILYDTAQWILSVLLCGTDGVLRKVKLPVVLVPGLNSFFSTLAATQKGLKAVIAKNRSSLDLCPFSVWWNRCDDMDYLDLTIATESRRTESVPCAILGKIFGNESVLTTLTPKKPVALSVGSIDVDQRVLENVSVEHKNNSST